MTTLTIEAMIIVATAIFGALGWLWRTASAAATKATRLESCIEDLEDDLATESQDRKHLSMKVDALDRSHNDSVNRIVRLETDLTAIRKSTERTERNVDELVKIQRDRP